MCAQAAAMMRMDLSKRYLADETNDEKIKIMREFRRTE